MKREQERVVHLKLSGRRKRIIYSKSLSRFIRSTKWLWNKRNWISMLSLWTLLWTTSFSHLSDREFCMIHRKQLNSKLFIGSPLSFITTLPQNYTQNVCILYRVRHLTFFSTSVYFVNGNT